MKPVAIRADLNLLPEELRRLPIWLVWEYRLKQGNWSKIPLIADGSGRFAKTNDPATWRSYQDALHHIRDGIGLRFTDMWCGIDLDCCRDLGTGTIQQWAWKIVERVNSYTEVSPSGLGLHIIAKLEESLPQGQRKRGSKDLGWEIGFYDATSPRYFCCTGAIFEGFSYVTTV